MVGKTIPVKAVIFEVSVEGIAYLKTAEIIFRPSAAVFIPQGGIIPDSIHSLCELISRKIGDALKNKGPGSRSAGSRGSKCTAILA